MIEQTPKTARIVGRFDACGRVRSHDEAAKAKRRADYDKWLAGRCEGLGINAYRRRDEVTAVDLLSHGEIAITLPPVYCNRRFFQTIAASENAQHLRLATLFFDPANGPGSGLKVYEVVLRSKQGKAHVADYHRAHMDFITEAGRAIKHLKRRGLIETLLVARHPRPCANGWIIDDHVHFLFYLEGGTLQEVKDYLGDRFLMDPRSISRVQRPVTRIAYLIAPHQWRLNEALVPELDVGVFRDAQLNAGNSYTKGTSLPDNARRTGLDDEAFVHFWSETRDFHWVEVLGPLRSYRALTVPATHRLTDMPDGKVVVVPKAQKPPRNPTSQIARVPGPKALSVRLVWQDDVLRPAVLVLGWTGSWTELTARYDLRLAIRSAREAWNRSCGHNYYRETPTRSASINPYYEASRGDGWPLPAQLPSKPLASH